MTLFTPKVSHRWTLIKRHPLGLMEFCANNETALYKEHFYVKGVVKDLLHGRHPLLPNTAWCQWIGSTWSNYFKFFEKNLKCSKTSQGKCRWGYCNCNMKSISSSSSNDERNNSSHFHLKRIFFKVLRKMFRVI